MEQQRSSFESKRLLQRTFNVDINDPEQPLLLDVDVSSSSAKLCQSRDLNPDLATIQSAVSSQMPKNSSSTSSSSSHQKWNITQKLPDFEQKSQKDPNNSSDCPASGTGSPLPSGVIPSGLRSRSPQINSGWL